MCVMCLLVTCHVCLLVICHVLCPQVCLAAVGLTGDICRGLSNKVLPYCDDIMVMLLENLGVSAFRHQNSL